MGLALKHLLVYFNFLFLLILKMLVDCGHYYHFFCLLAIIFVPFNYLFIN